MAQKYSTGFLYSGSVSALILGLTSTVFMASEARADCPAAPEPTADNAVRIRLGLGPEVLAHSARYDNQDFLMYSANGFGDASRGDELQAHFYSSFLAVNGVAGDLPPIRQNPTSGAWEYDPDGLMFSNNFHRSWDGYAALVYDRAVITCSDIDPVNGMPRCVVFTPLSSTSGSLVGAFNSMGPGTASSIFDAIPGQSPYVAAQNIWHPDIFRDPDWFIEYSCSALKSSSGIVFGAQTLVHENWHSTVAPKHANGTNGAPSTTNSCRAPDGACDVFAFDASSHQEVYHSLGLVQYDRVGAYQLEQRWTCDLVEEPADWIPLAAQFVAGQQFYSRANQSFFTEIWGRPDRLPSPSDGTLPYDCGAPESLINVPADGITVCDQTGTLRCQIDSQCDDGVFGTIDSCIASGPNTGCCEHFIVE